MIFFPVSLRHAELNTFQIAAKQSHNTMSVFLHEWMHFLFACDISNTAGTRCFSVL